MKRGGMKYIKFKGVEKDELYFNYYDFGFVYIYLWSLVGWWYLVKNVGFC